MRKNLSMLGRVKSYQKFRSTFACLTMHFVLGGGANILHAEQPFFMAVGDPFDRVEGVSGDGSVVVGWKLGNGTDDAFRWTKSGGRIVLGGGAVRAFNTSYDGSVIVGRGDFGLGFEDFRWTSDGECDQPWSTSRWKVLVLWCLCFVRRWCSHGRPRLFSFRRGLSMDRRQRNDWVRLPSRRGRFRSYATNISAGGSVIVGVSDSSHGTTESFRWTNSDGMVGLGSLFGSTFSGSSASDVSADGSVVVGQSRFELSSNVQAYRWTSDSGMVGLGLLSGRNNSFVSDISADGSVIVGRGRESDINSTSRVFIWDVTHGMRDLRDVLVAEYGLNLGSWILSEAQGISADGRTIVGQGTNPDGNPASWIAQARDRHSARTKHNHSRRTDARGANYAMSKSAQLIGR